MAPRKKTTTTVDAGASVNLVHTKVPVSLTYNEKGIRLRVIDDKSANNILVQFAQRRILHEHSSDEDLKTAVYVPTGCLPFDLAIEGKGIPLGCVTLIYSTFGAGKTTLQFTAARGLCQSGKKVLYVDVESSDSTARKMGLIGPKENLQVPEGSFEYVNIRYYNELDAVANAFVKSSYDIMFLDSITAIGLTPDDESEENQGTGRFKKTRKKLEDASGLANEARVQSKWIKQFYLRIKHTNQALVYIAQERTHIDIKNPNATGPTAAASLAAKFFNNVQIFMRPSSNIKDGNRIIGRQAYLISEKSRDADSFISVPATVIFGRGVSNIELLKLMGKWLKLFESKGPYWQINIPGQEPVTVQGAVKLNEWIKENYSALVATFYDNASDFLLYIANGYRDTISSQAEALFAPRPLTDEEAEANDELEDEELTSVSLASDSDIEEALAESDDGLVIP